MIDREELLKRKHALVKQRERAFADFSAIGGAIQLLDQLLQSVDDQAKQTPSEDAVAKEPERT